MEDVPQECEASGLNDEKTNVTEDLYEAAPANVIAEEALDIGFEQPELSEVVDNLSEVVKQDQELESETAKMESVEDAEVAEDKEEQADIDVEHTNEEEMSPETSQDD